MDNIRCLVYKLSFEQSLRYHSEDPTISARKALSEYDKEFNSDNEDNKHRCWFGETDVDLVNKCVICGKTIRNDELFGSKVLRLGLMTIEDDEKFRFEGDTNV